ncbi:MAG TPA: aldehyde dehydrogenase family protein, partial [Gemmatimonadales bacterium]|nr:aldehyde dehydrogenase family protein [Gemmatimonadales bacterium]
MKTDLFINNEWRPALSGKRFPVENPATEEIIAEVAQGDAADADNAVKAARACFESDAWRGMSARKRGRLLFKTADLLEARLEEFARLETAHNGKTLFESKIEISMTVNTLRYYAGWADKITGETLPVEGPFFTYTLREPIGVVGAIVPWNFPLNIASWKFAPALATGCTMILKPASETPLTALLFAELIAEAGFPPG